MGLDRRRILETSLFDLEQIVTVHYLSRHADLSIDDAKDELTEFLKQNKNKTELHAVYVLSGEVNISDSVSSSSADDTTVNRKFYRTQLVRDCDLEEIRQTYKEVETCEIYALHTKPIKSLYLLYSVDGLEDAEYERTDPERSWLSYPETKTKTEEMLAHYGVISANEVKKKRTQKDLSLSTSRSPEPMAKKTKNNITSLFMQAAKLNKEETEKQRNVGKKANILLGEPIKHRGQRIVIDSKEQDVNDKTNSAENSTEITALEKKDIVETRNTLLTQDDIFSDGDSNPDKMDCEGNRKKEIAEEIVDPKKLPQFSGNDSLKNGSDCGSRKKVIRKEYVTETFLDVDGFMVTKQVLKEIELEPSSTNTSSETRGKTTNTKFLDNKERRNTKVSRGQAKISSFFQKK
ncbi:DNA polymerase subunit Cdc27 family protein [Acanthocheilonema viteae]